MNEDKIRKLAEEHAQWVSKTLKQIYKDAFIHGYKHGLEAKRSEAD